MYLGDGYIFVAAATERPRRIDISDGIGDVTRKRLLEKRASSRRNRPRECLVTLFDTRPSKLHGRAAASYPPLCCDKYAHKYPSLVTTPPRTPPSSFLFESRARGALKIPSSFTVRYISRARQGYFNPVSLSFG